MVLGTLSKCYFLHSVQIAEITQFNTPELIKYISERAPLDQVFDMTGSKQDVGSPELAVCRQPFGDLRLSQDYPHVTSAPNRTWS
jgi:hypothetical protein